MGGALGQLLALPVCSCMNQSWGVQWVLYKVTWMRRNTNVMNIFGMLKHVPRRWSWSGTNEPGTVQKTVETHRRHYLGKPNEKTWQNSYIYLYDTCIYLIHIYICPHLYSPSKKSYKNHLEMFLACQTSKESPQGSLNVSNTNIRNLPEWEAWIRHSSSEPWSNDAYAYHVVKQLSRLPELRSAFNVRKEKIYGCPSSPQGYPQPCWKYYFTSMFLWGKNPLSIIQHESLVTEINSEMLTLHIVGFSVWPTGGSLHTDWSRYAGVERWFDHGWDLVVSICVH